MSHSFDPAPPATRMAHAAPEPARHAPETRRLSHVDSGTRVTVLRIDDIDDALARLMAMGLCVGRRLEVVRQGNPLIVRLLGARVGISGRLAQRIVVDRGAV